MTRTRQDVWKLGEGWSDPLIWYARGVRALQARPIADRTSWRFLGAMHGIDTQLWTAFGYLAAGEALPPPSDRNTFWQQCQHQSWYFLPWHRGYVAAFEAIIRAAIAPLGGPADWALPYWNYNDTAPANAGRIPPAFQEARLPDGTPNPLRVDRRYGEDGQGNVQLTPQDIDLRALLQPRFAGANAGGSPGFGGPKTIFSHQGSTSGRLENQPHNIVHSIVGGQDPNDPNTLGLMGDPDTAALDPIFWIHHSNIDRLWEVWLKRANANANPTDAAWLTGPATRGFVVPSPNGEAVPYAAKDMLDTTAPKLDYVYEDVSDPLGGTDRLAVRMAALAARHGIAVPPTAAVEASVGQQQPAELIGANAAAVRVGGAPVETQVRLDRRGMDKVRQSLQPQNAFAAGAPKEPDRVFLNLENIKGANDAAVFHVYVNLPPGADPAGHPEYLAGTVSLFGVKKASREDDPHGGNGITEALDITHIVDALHLNNQALDHLNVRFVPRTRIRPEDKISVGRVSVYRQGP
ncbi:MAG: tyrosinase family protein [Alphaproteobacteria bacterium]|nr:tyrosinase family protein [Alphaproteobacteria bacterium]MBV9154320.1 tyrosinase family protein [Alphaproteobacteria bacterium]MBV9964332.1 tyrosinase family protein [Alphaproteobacteria bacterium]